MIRTIIGLGNPGKEYEYTRHNLGFRVVDELALRWGVRAFEQGRHCLYTEVIDEERTILVVRPITYMNRSGLAWLEMAERFDIAAEQAVIVCDDLNLPFGRMRIRSKGSDGGHNGLASILNAAGTEHLPRLRLGIGEPVGYWEDFVLSPFKRDEAPLVERLISTAADAVQTL
ncbi:MAG: aminoacyl-tRNA hydrolase, partial [bacterium]